MARAGRSETVFFRYDNGSGAPKDVQFRINPIAVRWTQNSKSSVTETLAGYFREFLYSEDPQYNGLMMPDVVVEATTGAAYRKELEEIKWIWKHQADKKGDNSPVDIYFHDVINNPPFQEIERNADRIWLIHIQQFAWDDTVQDPYEIKFSIRFKILRDMLGEMPPDPPPEAENALQLETIANPIEEIAGLQTTEIEAGVLADIPTELTGDFGLSATDLDL